MNGSLILAGAAVACGIGMLGELLQAIRAGSIPVASGMRALSNRSRTAEPHGAQTLEPPG